MSGQKRPHSAAYDSPAPSSRSRPSAATPPPSKRPRPDPSTRTDTGTASQHAGRVAGDSYGWASPLTGALESLRQLRQWVASTAAAAAAPDPIPPRPKSLVDGLAGTRTGPQSSRTLREIKRKAAEIDSEKRAYYRARLDAKRNNQPMPEKPERLKDLQATLSGLRLDERAASEALDARDTAEGRRNGPALNGSAYHRRRPMGMSKHRSQIQERDRSDLSQLASPASASREHPPSAYLPFTFGADASASELDAPEADDDDPDSVEAYRHELDAMLADREDALGHGFRSPGASRMPPRRGTYPQDLLRPSQNDLGQSQRWNAGFPKPKLLGTASYSYLGDRSNRRPSLRDGKVSSIDRLPSDFERFVAIARKSQDEPTPEEMREWEALQRRRKEDEAEMERRMLEASKVKAIKKRAFPKQLSREHQKTLAGIFGDRRYSTSIKGAEAAWRDMSRLNGDNWLNDELINYYGVMINNRSNAADEREKAGAKNPRGTGERRLLKSFCFNTNFFTMFEDGGFAKVKRWTRRFNTFEKDIIIVPINYKNTHWCCAAVNLKEKRFEYHDSLGGPRPFVYKALRSWLQEEHKSRKGSEIDLSDWEDYYDDAVPQQKNMNDCGVFTCMFMESLSRDHPGFDFQQKNMTYLRARIALEIDNGELMDLEDFA
ncbi:hypothetical protein JCM8202_002757 [Rhodotorula sphaerocarpa]